MLTDLRGRKSAGDRKHLYKICRHCRALISRDRLSSPRELSNKAPRWRRGYLWLVSLSCRVLCVCELCFTLNLDYHWIFAPPEVLNFLPISDICLLGKSISHVVRSISRGRQSSCCGPKLSQFVSSKLFFFLLFFFKLKVSPRPTWQINKLKVKITLRVVTSLTSLIF